jgi:hypothetical protein
VSPCDILGGLLATRNDSKRYQSFNLDGGLTYMIFSALQNLNRSIFMLHRDSSEK